MPVWFISQYRFVLMYAPSVAFGCKPLTALEAKELEEIVPPVKFTEIGA